MYAIAWSTTSACGRACDSHCYQRSPCCCGRCSCCNPRVRFSVSLELEARDLLLLLLLLFLLLLPLVQCWFELFSSCHDCYYGWRRHRHLAVQICDVTVHGCNVCEVRNGSRNLGTPRNAKYAHGIRTKGSISLRLFVALFNAVIYLIHQDRWFFNFILVVKALANVHYVTVNNKINFTHYGK